MNIFQLSILIYAIVIIAYLLYANNYKLSTVRLGDMAALKYKLNPANGFIGDNVLYAEAIPRNVILQGSTLHLNLRLIKTDKSEAETVPVQFEVSELCNATDYSCLKIT